VQAEEREDGAVVATRSGRDAGRDQRARAEGYCRPPSAKTSRPCRDGAVGSPFGRRLGCLRAARALTGNQGGTACLRAGEHLPMTINYPPPAILAAQRTSVQPPLPARALYRTAMRQVAGNGRLQRDSWARTGARRRRLTDMNLCTIILIRSRINKRQVLIRCSYASHRASGSEPLAGAH
jgi:hypothetical protein